MSKRERKKEAFTHRCLQQLGPDEDEASSQALQLGLPRRGSSPRTGQYCFPLAKSMDQLGLEFGSPLWVVSVPTGFYPDTPQGHPVSSALPSEDALTHLSFFFQNNEGRNKNIC